MGSSRHDRPTKLLCQAANPLHPVPKGTYRYVPSPAGSQHCPGDFSLKRQHLGEPLTAGAPPCDGSRWAFHCETALLGGQLRVLPSDNASNCCVSRHFSPSSARHSPTSNGTLSLFEVRLLPSWHRNLHFHIQKSIARTVFLQDNPVVARQIPDHQTNHHKADKLKSKDNVPLEGGTITGS